MPKMKKQNGYKGQKTNLLSLPSLSLSVQFPKNKPITRSVKSDSKLKQNSIRGLSITQQRFNLYPKA